MGALGSSRVGTSTGTVAEDGTASAGGTLTATDADAADKGGATDYWFDHGPLVWTKNRKERI